MPSNHIHTNVLLAVILVGCSSATITNPSAGVGGNGTSPNGGNSATSAGASSSSAGNSNNVGGITSANTGGKNNAGSSATANTGGIVTSGGGVTATGGTGNATGGIGATGGIYTGIDVPTGGASSSSTGGSKTGGGATSTGGKSSTSTGGVTTGTTSGSGGQTTNVTGGTSSTGGASSTSTGGTTVSYMTDPPDQCHDLDQLPWSNDPTTGCVDGNTASKCGGKCQTASVCEDPSSKPNADREYMCPRNLLFSPEMEQAVQDDGLDGFHYAVVGHDPDTNGIDGNAHPCCQCYQLVYAYPSPSNERQVQLNPDNPNPPASAITVPTPLIVQAFNTAASPTTFDVYMPAGGMGAQNGCFLMSGGSSQRKYMYSNYPLDGQPGNGGVKPASLWSECKTSDKNWVTEETITSTACVSKTKAACDKITSSISGLSEEARANCLKANTIDTTTTPHTSTFYHLNWSVYAMKVECPEHLTRVTGCKLASQGLKAVKKDVKTADAASKDSDFWKKTGNSSNLYETTTMEDCCRPTCASYSQISNFGLTTDPKYRSFYNCDINGVPWTQPQ